MPPRYAYWTILAGGLPTAFRAADRDDLLPTFHRLREKHPDAEMKWFARGKLWESPEQAREEQRRPDRGTREDARGAAWRPGGTHRDPRQKFKDAKKARNVERRHDRFQRKHAGPPVEKPHGDARLHPPPRDRRPDTDRPRSTMTRGNTTRPPHSRPFRPRDTFGRNQGPDEPAAPARPARPNREPRPGEQQKLTKPPRPSEPTKRPSGPPERGRRKKY